MCRYAGRRVIDPERGRVALGYLSDLPLRRYPHRLLLHRVWELRYNLTAYDAVYVSLAELLGASLLTCDRRLATAAARYTEIDLV